MGKKLGFNQATELTINTKKSKINKLLEDLQTAGVRMAKF